MDHIRREIVNKTPTGCSLASASRRLWINLPSQRAAHARTLTTLWANLRAPAKAQAPSGTRPSCLLAILGNWPTALRHLPTEAAICHQSLDVALFSFSLALDVIEIMNFNVLLLIVCAF